MFYPDADMLPLLRELSEGIPVFTEDGKRIGDSVEAAKRAIPMVIFSRVMMAVPGMCKWLVINM